MAAREPVRPRRLRDIQPSRPQQRGSFLRRQAAERELRDQSRPAGRRVPPRRRPIPSSQDRDGSRGKGRQEPRAQPGIKQPQHLVGVDHQRDPCLAQRPGDRRDRRLHLWQAQGMPDRSAETLWCRLNVTPVEIQPPHRRRQLRQHPAHQTGLADPARSVHESHQEGCLLRARRGAQFFQLTPPPDKPPVSRLTNPVGDRGHHGPSKPLPKRYPADNG